MVGARLGGQPKRMPRIDRGVKIVLDALYPMRCPICRHVTAAGFCHFCCSNLKRIDTPCPQCGASFSGPGVCGACQTKSPQYDFTLAPFRYAPPLSGLIQQLKYHRKIALARPLALLLLDDIVRSSLPIPQLLIPVPLHISRLLRRGFNQSVELVRYLSRELGIPTDRSLAYRNRSTRSQATLIATDRRRNVSGCFGLRRPLRAKSVAIVDDVVTSGETVNELARVLRKRGAALIQVWAPLRT